MKQSRHMFNIYVTGADQDSSTFPPTSVLHTGVLRIYTQRVGAQWPLELVTALLTLQCVE